MTKTRVFIDTNPLFGNEPLNNSAFDRIKKISAKLGPDFSFWISSITAAELANQLEERTGLYQEQLEKIIQHIKRNYDKTLSDKMLPKTHYEAVCKLASGANIQIAELNVSKIDIEQLISEAVKKIGIFSGKKDLNDIKDYLIVETVIQSYEKGERLILISEDEAIKTHVGVGRFESKIKILSLDEFESEMLAEKSKLTEGQTAALAQLAAETLSKADAQLKKAIEATYEREYPTERSIKLKTRALTPISGVGIYLSPDYTVELRKSANLSQASKPRFIAQDQANGSTHWSANYRYEVIYSAHSPNLLTASVASNSEVWHDVEYEISWALEGHEPDAANLKSLHIKNLDKDKINGPFPVVSASLGYFGSSQLATGGLITPQNPTNMILGNMEVIKNTKYKLSEDGRIQ